MILLQDLVFVGLKHNEGMSTNIHFLPLEIPDTENFIEFCLRMDELYPLADQFEASGDCSGGVFEWSTIDCYDVFIWSSL